MNRNVTVINIGDHNTDRKRYRLIIQDDPSGPALSDIQRRQSGFLQLIVENPALLACGPAFADRLTIFHDGNCWTLHAEAEGTTV